MLVYIRGAGDLASGIALRLFNSNFRIIMSDIAEPTAVRRTVSFCEAMRLKETMVEGIRSRLVSGPEEAVKTAGSGMIALLNDPEAEAVPSIAPDALVDCIMAKKNLGTTISMAPIVIGVGPGFTAGVDCHAAVETKRGHTLGRVIYSGSPIENTGIPGNIEGFTSERLLRAPADGILMSEKKIGDIVKAGDIAARVNGEPVICGTDGMIRGLLPDGIRVYKGMKSGDIDPRGKKADHLTVSDKALAIGGGVLEAILHFKLICG